MKNPIEKLKSIFDWLIGSPDELSMGQRLMSLICIIAMLSLLPAPIISYAASLPLVAVLLPMPFIIMACIYYYLIRFRKYSKEKTWHVLILFQVLLTLVFFVNVGSYGTTFFAFLLEVVIILFMPKRKILFFFVLLNMVVLLVVEHRFPNLITKYPDEKSRYVDFLFGTIAICLSIYYTVNLFRQAYEKERENNLRHNRNLKEQKEQSPGSWNGKAA